MRQLFEAGLFKGMLVGGLMALVALAIWIWPGPGLPGDAPAPTATPSALVTGGAVEVTISPDEKSEASESPSATPSATALPTITPLFSPPPSAAPTSTATPVPSSTPTPEPSPSHTPGPTSPSPSSPAPSSTSDDADSSPIETMEWSLAGRVEQGAYPSYVTDDIESYLIYLPPDYAQGDRRYPVLYLLHGWPYDESHWNSLGVSEVADRAIVSGTLSSLIIVMPGARERIYIQTSGGDHSFEGQVVNDLIPHIDASYRTQADRQGRAIGGISRGGVWSLEIGFRNAELFGAVGAHSPALSVNNALPAYDPFNLMSEPGVSELRIYLSVGDRDWAWKSTEALHEALTEQAIASDLAVHEGSHRSTLWSEHLDEYLAFYTATW